MAKDRIEGEIILDNSQFTSATKQSAAAASDLGKRFTATSNEMSKGAQAAFTQINNSLKSVEETFKKSTEGINRHIKSINFEKAIGQIESLGSKARSLFSDAIGVGAGFEGEINKIGSITGASRAQLDQYAETIRKMSGELDLAARPAETAAIAYEAFSSNFDDIGSAGTIATNTLKLIADGTTQAGDATKLLTGALNAYGASAADASKFTDILFQTQNFGTTTIQELSNSLGLVTSTAAATGVPFEELAAAMATTTTNSIQTSSSVEGLRGLLIRMIDPTKESAEAQKKYGIEVNATTLRQKGLLGTLREIRAAVGDDSAAFNDIAGSAQAYQVALALTNDGTVKFAENLEKMRTSAGAADRAVDKISQGLDYSKRQFSAALDTFQIGATKSVIPVATAIIKAGTSILYALDKIPQPLKTMGLLFTGLVGTVGLAAGAVASLNFTMGALGLTASGLAAQMVLLSGATEFYLTMNVGAFFSNMGRGATAAATGIRGLLAPALAEAGAVMGGLAGSIGLATLALGVAFPAAIGAVLIGLTKIEEEATAAGEALIEATDLRKHGREVQMNIHTADILGKSASQLKGEGITADTILQNAIREKEGSEQLRNNGDPAKAQAAANRARELRKLAQEVRDLKDEERTIVHEQTEEEKAARKDALSDALQEIELSKLSHKQKIAEYEGIRGKFALNADEERALKKKIAQEQKAEDQNQAKYLKDLHKERLAEKVQEIENGKETTKVKISQLKELIKAHHLIGQEKRSIEDKVYAYEQQIEKKRLADAEKKRKDLAKLNERKENRSRDDADSTISESERRTRADQRLQERGLDTSGSQAAEIRARLKAEQDKLDSQARSDIAKETDASEHPAILEKAKRDKIELEKEALEEIANLRRDQGERNLKSEADRVTKEVSLQDRRVSALKGKIEDGKIKPGTQTNDEIEDAILKRLALLTQEIQLQAELDQARTNDPREAAQIEEEAQGRITDARKAARKEIEETNRAIDEQKRKNKEGSSEFGGNILSLDQFVKGEHDRFYGDANKPESERNKRRSGALSRLDFEINDATRRQIYDSQPRTKEQLQGQYRQAKPGEQGAVKVEFGGTFVLKNEKGEKIGEAQDLSINGNKYKREARSGDFFGN